MLRVDAQMPQVRAHLAHKVYKPLKIVGRRVDETGLPVLFQNIYNYIFPPARKTCIIYEI